MTQHNTSSQEDIIAELQTKIEQQDEQLNAQAYRIQHLEDRLMAWEYKINKYTQSDEQISQLKKELMVYITSISGQPQTTSSSVVSAQLEHQTKTLTTLTRQVEKTQRYSEQMNLVKTDFDHMTTQIGMLQNQLKLLQRRFEETIQHNKYLEDQRRLDARRLTEVQGELPSLQRKVETTLLAKIHALEQQMPQFTQYQLALEKIKEEARHHQGQLDYQFAQRERQIKSWVEQSEEYEQRIHRYATDLDKYAEQYRESRRIIESLHDFQERLQRDQHQTSELQRLMEERQQSLFDKWRTDYEKRWQQQDLQWKPSVSEVQRTLQLMQKQLDDVHKFNRTIEEQLEIVLKIIEEDVYHRSTVAQTWQQRFEAIAGGDKI
ncbi:hypothetical protein QUF58_12260 [Anaerolineales bacterium HSG24]|nr:hypothetical protein [Anaerolineales bacterium HSG24]